MKISLMYDVFKNQKPIPNGCPLSLIDIIHNFNYGNKKQIRTDGRRSSRRSRRPQDDWFNYQLLPTNEFILTDILKILGHEIINQSINEEIDSSIALYDISPSGDVTNCFGLGPNPPFTDIMSDKAKELIKNRSIKLVINHFTEGWSINNLYFSQLHKLLMNSKIPSDNVYYLTSNLILKKEYQQWCKKHYIEPINIIVGSYFELVTFNEYYDTLNNDDNFQQLQSIKKIRSKKFLCYNRRPHSHRHALICLLSKENLLKDFLISWPAPINKFNEEDFTWQKFNQLYPSNQSLHNLLMTISESLKKTTPWILDQENFCINFAYNYNYPDHYRSSYFSIVTEAIFSGSTVFFSEKIWKPIINLHPFLLVSTKGSLNKLRELGYKTFNPYINEEYDLIENDGDRLLAIIKEIKRLSNISISELDNMYYNNILPILIHNKDVFYNTQNQYTNISLKKLLT